MLFSWGVVSPDGFMKILNWDKNWRDCQFDCNKLIKDETPENFFLVFFNINYFDIIPFLTGIIITLQAIEWLTLSDLMKF